MIRLIICCSLIIIISTIRSFRKKSIINTVEFYNLAFATVGIVIGSSLLIRIFENQQIRNLLKDDILILTIGALAQIIISLDNQEFKNDFKFIFRKYSENEDLYKQTLQVGEKILDVNLKAQRYYEQKHYLQAEKLYQQALEMRRIVLGNDDPEVAQTINDLAAVYEAQGRYSEAEDFYNQALEIRKELLGENHPAIAQTINNLAVLYYSQDRFVESEKLYNQALDMRKKLLGENHPAIAQTINNLAVLYEAQGRDLEAEQLYHQALEIRNKPQGDKSPDLAQSYNSLAKFYHSKKKIEKAEEFYIKALSNAELLLGQYHPRTLVIRKNIENIREERKNTEL